MLQMRWQHKLLPGKRKKGGQPLGLKNLGNSCYLNSVLQCLTYTPPLAHFCLSSLHSSSCDTASELDRKRDCPFCILEKRIARSLSVDLQLDAPVKILNCLRIYSENFKSGRQEDAHEFLRYVIDACHNTCLRLKKLQQQRVKKSVNGSGGESVIGDTVVKEIFGGALQSQVKCLSCGNESNKVDEIMDICLEISGCSSLKEALKKFFQAETLDGNNKYKCERCKKLVAAKKQMSILQAPNVLVVQLKRFEGIFGGKIDRLIAFEEILVLSSFMCKSSLDPHPEYSLFATIVHSGFSPDSGHYYAYIKDAMERWYCCNDSYVTLSTLPEVLSEKAYILFFTRTSQRPAAADSATFANGVKSHESNGNHMSNGVKPNENNGSYMSKNPECVASAKALSMRSSDKPLFGNIIPVASKSDHSSALPQNKFNGFSVSTSKKISSSVKGKVVQKRESTGSNGNAGHAVCKQMNGNYTYPLSNNSGNCINGKQVGSSKVFVNGNGHIQNEPDGFVKEDGHEDNTLKSKDIARKAPDNGVACNGLTNGHADISGSKRKLEDRDPCVLLAQDAQSRSRVEEFKQVLQKEASLLLQSCGWTDKLYKYMRSRKRLCMDTCTSTDTDEQKKMLIADAKTTFISQIPGSLKGSLIERIRSFSRGK